MDTDWESEFPMVSVRALEHIERLSDYAPILMTTGSLILQYKHPFKFELGWLHCEGFHVMVNIVWERPFTGSTPIQRWNNNLRSLCRHLISGWARHVTSNLKVENLRLSSIIDDLEAKAEVRPLST
jgi:hypothetical protein